MTCRTHVSGIVTRPKHEAAFLGCVLAWPAGKGLELIPSSSKRAPEDSQGGPDFIAGPPSLPAFLLEVAEMLVPPSESADSDTELGTDAVCTSPAGLGDPDTAQDTRPQRQSCFLPCPSVRVAQCPGRRHRAPGTQRFWCSTSSEHSPANTPAFPARALAPLSSQSQPRAAPRPCPPATATAQGINLQKMTDWKCP